MIKGIHLLSLLILFSCGQPDKKGEVNVKSEKSENHIEVLDFHTDHRCVSCLKIEELTRATLKESFQAELNDSLILFSLINVDSPENQTIAEEYEAFGTALMISVFKDGEESVLDLTEWAFNAIHGTDFKSELKKELKDALKQL
ncbi:MAG: nitrophenyl compound nitroreductase subunit ArsF family protein [Crocinitomicaceae bacterium]